jgi:hypothetical protein
VSSPGTNSTTCSPPTHLAAQFWVHCGGEAHNKVQERPLSGKARQANLHPGWQPTNSPSSMHACTIRYNPTGCTATAVHLTIHRSAPNPPDNITSWKARRIVCNPPNLGTWHVHLPRHVAQTATGLSRSQQPDQQIQHALHHTCIQTHFPHHANGTTGMTLARVICLHLAIQASSCDGLSNGMAKYACSYGPKLV